MVRVDNAFSAIDIATCNMHGFKQGVTILFEPCASFDVIFSEEHWLLTDQLYKLSDMADDFRCLCLSMDDVCSNGIVIVNVSQIFTWLSIAIAISESTKAYKSTGLGGPIVM